ncbi:putative invasin [Sodalis glossinidius str. 'morsitans']|uniref:Invasin n=1 Tax=Sodalis glossinidius (strain morsitans) TaxID=343509 RepID=Q2NVE8_SODGM|nr:inverse autotransporter beta domain-containing protein [Sodalis glossinidius]BAE73877.1 putative invasin [Sodalis glossinidius str. 'morsitans']
MKKVYRKKDLSWGLILFTWLNIGIQAIVPLTYAFVPSQASAAGNTKFLKGSADKATLDTKTYTLATGETTASVAQKYHMSLEALRKLNQFRTFARGFDHLQPGDELDVPLAPLPAVTWAEETPVPASASKEDLQAQKIAGIASQAGNFLANSPRGDAAASIARGMATGAASTEVQQWLSQFGTARLQLDVDNKFSLKNSQLDLLIPLYEQPDKLVFTQGSLHRTDDRTQTNLGMGMRWFNDGYMLGGNTFLDYDLSRDHARMGMGVEYWRDYLKIGANNYLRLTNWRDSKDFADYQERPANGWDMSLEGWVPALPQLGGNLKYEQYYGKEVALFGKDNRQKDPHAITVGVNYTPFPLLTFSADQRQGKAGQNDTRLGVQLNIQLGTPWQHQLDTSAVGAMRTLAGSRYDLVDRNNNIVLEYRKKEVIHLYTADHLAGYAGEQKSLNVSINTKYGLERIDWSAPELLAAGGKIVQESIDNYSIVLPDYNFDSANGNVYEISGVAIDTHGNVSKKAKTTLTVTQPAINTTTSEFTPVKSTLPADTVAQQTLTLKVKDIQGNPVDIGEDEITVTSNNAQENSGAKVSALQRQDSGIYTLVVTAGTGTDVIKITPSARGANFASASVTVEADGTTAQIKALEVVSDNAAADGQATNQVKVTVIDANGNPIPNHVVSFSADNGATIIDNATTNANGAAVADLTSVKASEVTVTAALDNQVTKTVKTTFVSDDKSAMVAELKVVSDGATADGKAENQLKVSVTDANGNVIEDKPVTLQAEGGVVLSTNSVTTDKDGTATFNAMSTTSGTFKVTATTNGYSKTASVVFVAGGVVGVKSTLAADKSLIASNGSSAISLTFTAHDNHNNAVTGLTVAFEPNGVEGKISTVSEQDGVYTATFTSTKTGVGTIGVAVNGTRLEELTAVDAGVYSSTLSLSVNVSS